MYFFIFSVSLHTLHEKVRSGNIKIPPWRGKLEHRYVFHLASLAEPWRPIPSIFFWTHTAGIKRLIMGKQRLGDIFHPDFLVSFSSGCLKTMPFCNGNWKSASGHAAADCTAFILYWLRPAQDSCCREQNRGHFWHVQLGHIFLTHMQASCKKNCQPFWLHDFLNFPSAPAHGQ